MKLIKLLLVGLLSVSVLFACEGNSTTIPKKETPAEPLSIVGVYNKVTPVLFDNVTIKIRAIDKKGKTVKAVTWDISNLVNVHTGIDVDNGTVSLKIKDGNGKGTIKAKAKIGNKDVKAEYRIVISDIPLTKINITPTNPTVAMNANISNPSIQLKALASFGSTVLDVTDDVNWTIPPPYPAPTTIITPLATGITVDNVTIRATLTSGKLTKDGITKVAAKDSTIAGIEITGITKDVPVKSGSIVQLGAMLHFDVITDDNGSITPEPFDVTEEVAWASSTPTVATVGDTAIADIGDSDLEPKGLLTIISFEGTSTISASKTEYGDSATMIVTASPPDDRITTFTVKPFSGILSEADTKVSIEINETLIGNDFETLADLKNYTCEIKSGTGIVYIDNGTSCDMIKTGTLMEHLETVIVVTNTIQSNLAAQEITITPSYNITPPPIKSFTVVAPDNSTLDKPDTTIPLTITEVYDIGNPRTGKTTDYTCRIVSGGGAVLDSGTATTATCDKLKTGLAGSAEATVVEVKYTTDNLVTNNTGDITITPVYPSPPPPPMP